MSLLLADGLGSVTPCLFHNAEHREQPCGLATNIVLMQQEIVRISRYAICATQ